MRNNLPAIYAGAFAPKGSLADAIHVGRNVAGEIEDELYRWGWEVDRISTDFYDNSLEVYFEKGIVGDPEIHGAHPGATPEQQATIFSWGFNRFWLNYNGGNKEGGTERYYVSPEFEARAALHKASLKQATT